MSSVHQLICGLIAEGTEKKGEYIATGGAKKLGEVIVQKILPKLPRNNHKKTLTQKDMEFHYKYSGNYVYFCVAKVGTPKRVCWSFIDELESEFLKLNNPKERQIKELIKTKINHFNDPNNDSITRVRAKVDDVKDVMIDNIDKILDRGDKLENLVQSTDDLAQSAQVFKTGTAKVKNQQFWKLVCLIVLLVCIVLTVIAAVIIIIVFAVCKFPTFDGCKPNK